MNRSIPADISIQTLQALSIIEHHIGSMVLAVHLYGSAIDGGLKPYSDIDLLVTITAPLSEQVRQAMFTDFLNSSAFPGKNKTLRALEVTIVVYSEVVPWRYPARRELQFGEWLRQDILAGSIIPATADADLAILITQARQHSIALVGPVAEHFFEPIPKSDLCNALAHTLTIWNSQQDWAGDERNVVLTLCRIWYSASTGKIAPKDIAANWAMKHSPTQYQSVLLNARQAYLGEEEDILSALPEQVADFINFAKGNAIKLLDANTGI